MTLAHIQSICLDMLSGFPSDALLRFVGNILTGSNLLIRDITPADPVLLSYRIGALLDGIRNICNIFVMFNLRGPPRGEATDIYVNHFITAMNVTKYPPSPTYFLFTISVNLFLLSMLHTLTATTRTFYQMAAIVRLRMWATGMTPDPPRRPARGPHPLRCLLSSPFRDDDAKSPSFVGLKPTDTHRDDLVFHAKNPVVAYHQPIFIT